MFIDEPVKYIEESYQLKPGDKIIAYTDGLVEWRNKNKEVYGINRLLSFILKNRKFDCHTLIQAIYDDVMAFAVNENITDDLTMLIAEYS